MMADKPYDGAIDTTQLLALFHDAAGGYGASSAFAKKHGLSESLISVVGSGKQKIGPKIAAALGYRRIVLWVPLHDEFDVS